MGFSPHLKIKTENKKKNKTNKKTWRPSKSFETMQRHVVFNEAQILQSDFQ